MHKPLRSSILRVLAMLLLCFSVAAIMPMEAYAQAAPSEAPEGSPSKAVLETTIGSCENIPEVQGGKLLGKIVPCMISTIESATIDFAAEMVDTLRPLLYTFLLLVVVLFGVRMLSQEPQIHKQGFLLLVKIAIIAIILNDLGNTQAYDGSAGGGKLIPAVYDIMNESQKIVAGAISTTNVTCEIDKFAGPNTPKVWAMMDCVMSKLWGFTTGTDPNTGQSTTNMLLVSSFFGMMTGFFFSGAWGVTIFLGMLGTLFTIFMMVVRTALGFVTSYLTICLMLILSPLLLPLAFLKVTTAYFDSTWRIILAAFLTPIIITAYSMFSMILYDKVLFNENAPIQTLFKYENIKEALQPAKPACGATVTNNPYALRFDNNNPSDADLKKTFGIPFLKNTIMPTLTGGNEPCGPLKITPLDEDKIKGFIPASGPNADADRREAFRKIIEQLLSLFIIAYLIQEGLQALPTLIYQIVGKRSASSALEAVVGDGTKIQQRTKEIYEKSVAAFSGENEDGSLRPKSGAEFLKDLPSDIGKAKDGIIEVIKRKEE